MKNKTTIRAVCLGTGQQVFLENPVLISRSGQCRAIMFDVAGKKGHMAPGKSTCVMLDFHDPGRNILKFRILADWSDIDGFLASCIGKILEDRLELKDLEHAPYPAYAVLDGYALDHLEPKKSKRKQTINYGRLSS